MPASTAIASFFAPATQAVNASASSNAGKAGNDGVFASLVEEAQGTASATTSPLLSLLAGNNPQLIAQDASADGATPALSPELRSLLASMNAGAEAVTLDTTETALPSDVSALALLIAQFQQPQAAANAEAVAPPASGAPAAGTLTPEQLLASQDATAIVDALASLNGGATGESLDPAFAQLLHNSAATATNAQMLAKAKTPVAANGGEVATSTAATPDTQSLLQGTTTDTRSAIAQPGQSHGHGQMNGGTFGGSDAARPFDVNLQAATPQSQPQFQVELAKAQQAAPSGPLLPQVPLEALAVQIARRFEQGMSSFEISLSPAELGKLDISMQVSDDGRVHAVLRAERPETLELLKQDARALETQLRQAGLDVGSNALSFQLSQGNAQRQNLADRNGAFSSALNGNASTDEQTTTTYVATRKRDGIDIHV